MKIIFTTILLVLILVMPVYSITAAQPATKMVPVTTVPLKLGNYQFLQGDKAFADKIVSYQTGSPAPEEQYQHPEKALNKPNYKEKGYSSFVSLGCHGVLVVRFTDNVLMDGDGADLLVYEVGPSVEPTNVEISKDGTSWISVGQLKGNTRAIDLQGKVNKSDAFYFVKLTDTKVGGCKKAKKGAYKDRTAGADIDAVAVLNPAPAVDHNLPPTTDRIGEQSNTGSKAPNKSLLYTISSAEQGTGLRTEFQIMISAADAQFKDGYPNKARLVYWGEESVPTSTLSVSKKNDMTLVAQLPTGTDSWYFTSRTGTYKIGLIDVTSGGFISNTLEVIRHTRSEGPGGDGGDADGDGHDSLASGGDDCDDADPNRFPGNPEVGDFEGHDEDCDPTTFGNTDRDGDGYVDARICNSDSSGFIYCGTDCDDSNPGTHINLPEVCDGIDNNCDGQIDEGVMAILFKDADRDRFGNPEIARRACCGVDFVDGAFWTNNNTDCDDSDPDRNPIDGCD